MDTTISGTIDKMTRTPYDWSETGREGKMFIIVRYGENLEQIFNPNCLVYILLHHIKEKCQCERPDTIELSDENGKVKHLQRHLQDYAVDHLKDREVLILLKTDSDSADEDKSLFTPLVNSLQNNKDFLGKLNSRTRLPPSKRHQRAPSVQRFTPVDSRNDNTSPDRKAGGRKSVAGGRKSVSSRRTSRMSIVSPPKASKGTPLD